MAAHSIGRTLQEEQIKFCVEVLNWMHSQHETIQRFNFHPIEWIATTTAKKKNVKLLDKLLSKKFCGKILETE